MPSRPTVASRPSRWLPRYSISASLNTLTASLLLAGHSRDHSTTYDRSGRERTSQTTYPTEPARTTLGRTPQTAGNRLMIARSQVRGLPAPPSRTPDLLLANDLLGRLVIGNGYGSGGWGVSLPCGVHHQPRAGRYPPPTASWAAGATLDCAVQRKADPVGATPGLIGFHGRRLAGQECHPARSHPFGVRTLIRPADTMASKRCQSKGSAGPEEEAWRNQQQGRPGRASGSARPASSACSSGSSPAMGMPCGKLSGRCRTIRGTGPGTTTWRSRPSMRPGSCCSTTTPACCSRQASTAPGTPTWMTSPPQGRRCNCSTPSSSTPKATTACQTSRR